MGEGLIDRLFYLTAKTITRTVAQECFQLLSEQSLHFKFLTITAKEKMCFLEGSPECNPASCPYAKGHYDRVNDCVYDMLIHENDMNRDTILSYAEKHNVCPFEMCLDAALLRTVLSAITIMLSTPMSICDGSFRRKKKEILPF